MPTTELALRMLPEPCATIVSATACVQWNTPRRLTSMTASNCASVIFCRRASWVMPALLTSTSMRPKRASVAATIASTCARSVTSTTWPMHAAPSTDAAPTAAAAAATSCTSHATTLAPSRANFRAVARPMPWAAPVTTAILLARRMEMERVARAPLSATGSEPEVAQQVGHVRLEVGEPVIAARDQLDGAVGVARGHLAPVQHLVALGDDREDVPRMRERRRRRHRGELGDVLGAEVEALVGRVVHRLAADVGREVARGVDGRVHEHRAAVQQLGDDGGVEAAQRAADDAGRRHGPARDDGADVAQSRGGRGRQLRAGPDEVGPVARDPVGHPARLRRLRRRAEAVQVQQVRDQARAPANASSSLPWMPPKPPLLMHSTWSPGLATLTTADTSPPMVSQTCACSPSGASASTASHDSPPEWQNDRSASSSAHGSCAFIAPCFIVLERGSNTARMRCAPTVRRRPSMVVRIAVGWCAKSS